MKLRYIYTNHVLERLEERFKIKINWDNKAETYEEIDKMMDETKNDRSYLNNSTFMMNLYDLHGYDSKYEFRSHIEFDILFVTILERGRKIVKTCYPLSTTKFIKRKKFKRKKNDIHVPRSRRGKGKRRYTSLNEVEAVHGHLGYTDNSDILSLTNL